MCGICGKLLFDRGGRADSQLIARMTGVLRHRGPDDCGLYVDGPLGLGHARLSVIDLSVAGRQPMANEDNTLQIVCNGEIYNYRELRRELEDRHRFISQTDTEVILHLYEDLGPACVARLRGMFAFCIWDATRKELFLARDRAGKKPLVYRCTDSAFAFASETKALLEDPDVQRELDPAALHHYLTYQYVPGPLSIFRGICKLPPAHTLTVRDGHVHLQRYWDLSYTRPLEPAPLQEHAARFMDLFREAVRIRMRSDVPLGAFLSGGIDSSATVAVMSQLSDRPVKTFAIGFEEEDFNELGFARTVADRFQTEHTEFVVRPDALEVLPRIVWHYDEPFADPSAIPTYYVSRLTREHVTVALNGDGGDESFAGYERYLANELATLYLRIPAVLRQGCIAPLVARLPHREQRWSVLRRLKRFVGGAVPDPARRYVQWLCYFTSPMKQALYSDDLASAIGDLDSVDLMTAVFDRTDATTSLERSLYADVALYLPWDLLVKVDIASMAHSLEARSPFLDHEVMEFAARLPAGLKLHRLQTKYFLKKAFAGLLPPEILHRRKMGFGVPLQRWFCTDLRECARDVLLGQRARERGWFKPATITRLLDEHLNAQADHSYRLWALFCFELWQRMFIDRSEVLGI